LIPETAIENQMVAPETTVTGRFRPHRVALDRLGLVDRHRPGGFRENNRAENSHLSIRRRGRKMQVFKRLRFALRLPRGQAAVHSTFNTQRHLSPRGAMRVVPERTHYVWCKAVA